MSLKHLWLCGGRTPILSLQFWVRCGVFAAPLLAALLALLAHAPIPQDIAYHGFADRRPFLGIPNALDVLTNLPFFAIGVVGLRQCVLLPHAITPRSWQVFFAGVALVGLGSAWYHLEPNSGSLVWDRLPMTIAFMALSVSLIAGHTTRHAERCLLWPAVAVGVGSVAWWAYADDLRLYVWVQLAPTIVVGVSMVLSRAKRARLYLSGAALCYLEAKMAELGDDHVFRATAGLLSGHSLKHLWAAFGVLLLLRMESDGRV